MIDGNDLADQSETIDRARMSIILRRGAVQRILDVLVDCFLLVRFERVHILERPARLNSLVNLRVSESSKLDATADYMAKAFLEWPSAVQSHCSAVR